VSNQIVEFRRELLVLPIIGLSLFALGSYASHRLNQHHASNKYFYWSSIRLDCDPLNMQRKGLRSCKPDDPNCPEEDTLFISVHPGLVAKTLILSALPAFFLGRFLSHALGRLGVSELTTFMISVPMLMFGWYYFVSWIGFRMFATVKKGRPV
jgi:hypothetical protein